MDTARTWVRLSSMHLIHCCPLAVLAAQPPSPRTAAATAAAQLVPGNVQLLDSLGDPDKQSQQPTAAQQGRDWLSAVPAWVSHSSLARSALETLTAAAAVQEATGSTTATAGSALLTVTPDPAGPSLSGHKPRSLEAVGPPTIAAASAADLRSSSSNNSAASSSGGSDTTSINTTSSISMQAGRSLRASTGPPPPPPADPATGPGPDCNCPNGRSSLSTVPGGGAAASSSPRQPLLTAAAAASPAVAARAVHQQEQQDQQRQQQTQAGRWGGLKSYYRYIMSPAPEPALQACDSSGMDHDDVVQSVQEAAGAALAEANERLLDAELRLQAAQVSSSAQCRTTMCWCKQHMVPQTTFLAGIWCGMGGGRQQSRAGALQQAQSLKHRPHNGNC